MSKNIHVTLALPGLLWPHRETFMSAINLPALDKLRLWGRIQPQTTKKSKFYRQYLWHGSWLKLAKNQLGLKENHHCIIVVPISQSANLHEIHCISGKTLALSPAEAENFCQILNHWFKNEGWRFHALQPDIWLLTTPEKLQFSAPSVLDLNDSMDSTTKPTGRDAQLLLKYQTEIQMLLHQHPLNQERCLQGTAPINAIWFEPDRIGSATSNSLYTNCTWAHGAQQFPTDYNSFSAQLSNQCSIVLFAEEFCHPDIQNDRTAYEHLLQQWEQKWWKPLLTALQNRKIQHLEINTDGPHGGLLHVCKPCIPPFWRKNRPFNGLML